jgi:hypothetical protein
MIETVEFRIPESDAAKHLPTDLGERLSDTVRKVVVRTDDPMFTHIGRVDQGYRARGEFFFFGTIVARRYSRQELAAAELFVIEAKRRMEPAGEECGTKYNEASACLACGGGADQTTPLFMNGNRIPNSLDYVQTIAGERIVSARVKEVVQRYSLSGADLDPVRLTAGKRKDSHYQLNIVATAHLHRSTRVGEHPFDQNQGGRCPRGDVVGLNVLSDVRVVRSSYLGTDIAETAELIGRRVGLLRPRPIVLISPRAWRAFTDEGLKGLYYEVAHLMTRARFVSVQKASAQALCGALVGRGEGMPLGDSLWSTPTSRSTKSNRPDESPQLRSA